MRTLMVGMVLAVALAGCQATLPNMKPGAPTGNTPGGKVEAPPTQLAGLRFQAVSAETAAKLSQQGGMNGVAESTSARSGGGTSGAAAPMVAPAPGVASDMAIGAKMMPSPYYHGSYFSGPYGQMKLNSVTEAKAGGASGTFKEMHAAVIAPVLAAWAADARLTQTSGSVDESGRPIQGTENYPGENAWRASYASASRGEVLEFTINANETTVLRLQWVPINIDTTSLTVDTSDAVAALAKAIGDSTFKSQEEVLGKDYFFGDAATSGPGIGIAVPAIARTEPAMAVDGGNAGIAVGEPAPGMPAPDVYQPPKEEPVFKLATGGRWYINLQAIGDHLVWDLSYNPGPDSVTRSYNPGETFVDNYAYGMINARTGEIIRLRRPMKITLPTGPSYPKPEPRPMPVDDAVKAEVQ